MRWITTQLLGGSGKLVAGCLVLAGLGCTQEDEPKPDDDPTNFLYGEPDCHGSSNACFPTLTVDTDLLRLCFAWDGPAQAWPPGTPQAILDGCPNPETVGQDCVLSFEPEVGVECTNECGSCLLVEQSPGTGDLVPVDELDLAYDDCCRCDAAYNGLDDVIDALDACGDTGRRYENCPPLEWIPMEEGECEGDTFFHAPDADYVLHVDPLVSFLSLSVLGELETVAVSGGGSLTLTDTESLTATLWVEDGTLGGLALEGWMFWGTLPLDYNAESGTFLVPPEEAPFLPGRGELAGVRSIVELGMSSSATGFLAPASSLWTCDYTETLAGQSVHLHVEGTLEALP